MDTLYKSNILRSEKIRKKKQIIADFKSQLESDYDNLFTTQTYRGIEKMSFNNAFLAVSMTYTLDLDLFTKLLRKRKNSLREVVQFAIDIKKRKGKPKEHLENEIKSDEKS